MKRRISLPALAFLIVASMFASTQSSSAVVPDHGPSAFGEGAFSLPTGFGGIENWTYSFDVRANKNGQARGRAVFDLLHNSIQTQIVVRINCLEVISSSGFATAFMSGTVLHSNNPEFPKLGNVIFGADDSSGSPTVFPDIMTRPFRFEGVDCHDNLFPLTFAFQPPDAIHIEP